MTHFSIPQYTRNTASLNETYEHKQSGLTVTVGNPVLKNLGESVENADRAGEVKDHRLKALYVYRAARDAKEAQKASKNEKKLTVSASIGSSQYKSETNMEITSAQGSNLVSGGEVNITATGSGAKDKDGYATDGNVNIGGSKVDGKKVTLSAARDVNIKSAENTQDTQITSDGKSIGVGVEMSKGSTPGYFVEGSRSSSDENEHSLTHTESQITATDTLTIKSGRDTNIIGGQAKGEKVVAEIGRNLNVASEQDEETYRARNSSVGGKVGVGTDSNISANKGKTDSTYKSVNEQSGIFAGKEGYDIKVGENTDLKGAVIASAV